MVLNIFWDVSFAWVRYSASFWFIENVHGTNSKKLASPLSLVLVFVLSYPVTTILFLLSLFSAVPLRLLFFFFFKSHYSLPSWGSLSFCSTRIWSQIEQIGLCVIQEEAAKSKPFSFQRLSPKWCFLDCEYSVISTTLDLLPEHLLHFEHIQALVIELFQHTCNPMHLWVILSGFSKDRTGINASLQWRKFKKWLQNLINVHE